MARMEYVKNVLGPLDQTVQLHAKLITLDINVKIHVTVRRMKSAINTSVAKWLAAQNGITQCFGW